MKFLQQCAVFALSVGAIALTNTSAWALALTRQITLDQARNGVPVTVWQSGGVNLDFSRSGEVIQRAWLDDPSKVTIDFDGDLGQQGSRGSSGATIIHLRQIVGVQFPHLPQSRSTLLTVVTVAAGGGRNIYQFQINRANGTAQYNTLQLVRGLSNSPIPFSTAQGTTDVRAVERGLQRAIAQNLISSSSPVISRIQQFCDSLRNGNSPQAAAAQSRVSMALVSRLAAMGTPQPMNSPIPGNDTSTESNQFD